MEKPTNYSSREETQVEIHDPSGKWTNLTLLPEWEEEFYDVYTVKKHGKWVMLKALKKEFADDPKYMAMLENEFDTRYNLAHPNIVMVNDFDEIPGIGKAIITDDVYGYSLRRLIDEHRLTPKILHRLQTQLLDAMEYIQENHLQHYPITPESIIFTEYNENLKLINVGYAQKSHMSAKDAREDIISYGRILTEVLNNTPASIPRLKRIANKCLDDSHPYRSISDLHLAVEKRNSSQLFIFICIFILLMTALLVWLTLKY